MDTRGTGQKIKKAMTATERSREYRKRKKERSTKAELEKEKVNKEERVRNIILRKKKATALCSRTCKDPDCLLHPDRDRKRMYRQGKSDGRTKLRIKRRKEALEQVSKLKVKVKDLTNST